VFFSNLVMTFIRMCLLLLTQRKIAPTLILSLVFFHILFASSAHSWDRPFDNAANWLGTGLMEIPTARVLDDGVIRVSVAQALPFRWYGGGMGVFPGFEFTGRLTEITNIPSGLAGLWVKQDKAFDIKYQSSPSQNGCRPLRSDTTICSGPTIRGSVHCVKPPDLSF